MENRLILLCLLPLSLNLSLCALPEEGKVVSGKATFAQNDAHTLVINAVDKTVIHYPAFHIGENETVQFIQPRVSSTVLNRVTGSEPSQILGRLSSNGKVFLINKNGIVFGPNSQVHTGALIASVLDIQDKDFAAGKYTFHLGEKGKNAQIINRGNLTAESEGQIVLLAPHISNEGVITARAGKVALLGGENITLDFTGDGLMSFAVEGELEHAVIEHLGKISAAEGDIYLRLKSADRLIRSVVNSDGLVLGYGIAKENGVVRILSESQLEAKHVEIAGHDVRVEGEIKPSSQGKGSLILSAPQGTVSLESPLGLKRRFADLTIDAKTIDQNTSVKVSQALTYTGETYLGGRISTVGGDVTFNGPVVRDTLDSVLIYTGAGPGDVIFNGPIDGSFEDSSSRSLSISAGQGAVCFHGPIGLTQPLETLTVSTAETVAIQEVGSIGSLSITATGDVDLYGEVYHAAEQMWAAQNFNLKAAGSVDFVTRGKSLEFNGGSVNLSKRNQLAIHTHGGQLKLLSLFAPSFETVTVNTGMGKAQIGGVSGQVGLLSVSGYEIGVTHEIKASTIRMEAEANIFSEFEEARLLATGDIYLNARTGGIGELDSPFRVESGGFVHAGAKTVVNLAGACADDVIHTIPSNLPSMMFFNRIEYYDMAASLPGEQEEEMRSLAPDLFTAVHHSYTHPRFVKPRKARLYYIPKAN